MVLFDDAEELGFLGSRAFLEEHPWAADIGFAISVDTAAFGLPVLVDAQQPYGRLVREVAAGRADPVGSSLILEGIQRLGDQFDFQPFEERGIPGVAIEDIYAFRQQHTEEDRVDLVTADAVQAMGDVTLSLVRRVGQLDVSARQTLLSENRDFFTVPFVGLITLPHTAGVVMVAGSTVLLSMLLVLGHRRGSLTRRGTVLGAAVFGMLLVLVPVLTAVWWFADPALRVPDNPNEPTVHPDTSRFCLVGFLALALAIGSTAYLLALRRASVLDLWTAPMVVFLLVSGGLLFGLPGGAYAFALPLLLATATGLGLVVLAPDPESWMRWTLLAVVVVPTVVVFGLPMALGYIGNAFFPPGVLALQSVLLIGLLLPQLATVMHPLGWAAPLACAAVSVASFAAAYAL